MAKTNVLERPKVFTHEGAKALSVNDEQALRRSVMACLLWEHTFYEDGVAIADRIKSLIPKVAPEKVAAIAVEAREKMKLRHAPLLIAREMCRHEKHRKLAGATIERVIQRTDELAEFVSIYWMEGRTPLSYQAKKGLAAAFRKFNEYQLAKYNRDGAVKLRDVLFLCHAKPKDDEQESLWKKLVDNTLATPDTWEVALSGGANKKEAFERLIRENTIGGLALLRNLRNMQQAGCDTATVRNAVESMKTERILPFRFIAAARAVPQWESWLEGPMLKSLEERPKLKGKTVLLVDTSPSMAAPLSAKSDLSRMDAGFGLAVVARELCEDVEIWAFSNECRIAPPRRGFALADAIRSAVPSNGTLLGKAISSVSGRYDRLICITDEQSQDDIRNPDAGKSAYLLNVASYENGIGYGPWKHLDGFSESLVDWILEFEKSADLA